MLNNFWNLPKKTALYELSAEDDKVNNVNLGKLILLNKNVWLTEDVTTGSTTGQNIPHKCPTNYR